MKTKDFSVAIVILLYSLLLMEPISANFWQVMVNRMQQGQQSFICFLVHFLKKDSSSS